MTQSSRVRVIYVTDPRFKELTEFSAASLMLMSISPISIIVYCTAASRPLNGRLFELAQRLGHSIEETALEVASVVSENVSLHPHISPATLFKAQAIEKEATSHERIVFLDADILACKRLNLDEIFTFATTAGGVYDFVSYMPYDGQDLFRHRQRCGKSPDYFNAGVIAISGSRWKSRGISQKYIQSLEEHTRHCPFRHDDTGGDPGDCKGADQCAFNMALEEDWTPIDFLWNVQKPLRHSSLWRHAFLRHYTGFRKFLDKSNINRDSIERRTLAYIRKETGLRPDHKTTNDLGIMFLADNLKYFGASLSYAERVRFLSARAAERRRYSFLASRPF